MSGKSNKNLKRSSRSTFLLSCLEGSNGLRGILVFPVEFSRGATGLRVNRNLKANYKCKTLTTTSYETRRFSTVRAKKSIANSLLK